MKDIEIIPSQDQDRLAYRWLLSRLRELSPAGRKYTDRELTECGISPSATRIQLRNEARRQGIKIAGAFD